MSNKYGLPPYPPWPPSSNALGGGAFAPSPFGQGVAQQLGGLAAQQGQQGLGGPWAQAQQQVLPPTQQHIEAGVAGVWWRHIAETINPRPHNLGKEVLEELISPKALRGKK